MKKALVAVAQILVFRQTPTMPFGKSATELVANPGVLQTLLQRGHFTGEQLPFVHLQKA